MVIKEYVLILPSSNATRHAKRLLLLACTKKITKPRRPMVGTSLDISSYFSILNILFVVVAK